MFCVCIAGPQFGGPRSIRSDLTKNGGNEGAAIVKSKIEKKCLTILFTYVQDGTRNSVREKNFRKLNVNTNFYGKIGSRFLNVHT